MIASAVWREADSAAHQLPPLSQEVYNRLNYRDRAPSSRYSANPPQQARRHAIREQARRSSVPVTMVAGIAVALIFGALLIGLAMRNVQPNPQQIAMGGGAGGGGGDIGAALALPTGGIAAASTEEMSPTAIGIIPTQANNLGTGGSGRVEPFASFTPVPFVTNTAFATPRPLPTQVPATVPPANLTILQDATVPPPVSPTYTPMPPVAIAPENNGPYITLTPFATENGAPLCEIFNPTEIAITVYSQANFESAVSGFLMPNQLVRTIVISQEGWYFVVLPSLQRGWIAPQFAYLRGNCSKTVLWLATPTMIPTPIPIVATATFTGAIPALEAKVALITATYADLYAQPNKTGTIIGAVSRGEQYPIMAYIETGDNSWAQLDLGNGTIPWVLASQIAEYAPDEVPVQRTPQPTATIVGQ
jgi:hypothetical protein